MVITLHRESRLLKKYPTLAGVDEAGRGAWAGPIVAGAVLIDNVPKVPAALKGLIKDSKQLSPNRREEAYEFIINNFDWAVGIIENDEIDSIGIQKANRLVMQKAVVALKGSPRFILVDGRGFEFDIDYENVIKGDAKLFSIAAASIVAKVTRDRLMVDLAEMFPQYQFDKNKGYGTFSHYKALAEGGFCDYHRKSYQPMKDMV